jgi:hypothetical protein
MPHFALGTGVGEISRYLACGICRGRVIVALNKLCKEIKDDLLNHLELKISVARVTSLIRILLNTFPSIMLVSHPSPGIVYAPILLAWP